jgi:hypothetical protein
MTQPPLTKESQALVSSLAAQRDHVLGILEGLSEEDLQRPILPSHWTCAGLVHHLAIDSSGSGSAPSSRVSRCQTTSRITPGRSLRT